MSKTKKKKNDMVAMSSRLGLPTGFGEEGDELSIRVGKRGLIAKCAFGNDEKEATIIYKTGKRVRIIVDNLWDDFDEEYPILEENCVWDESDDE